METIPQTTNQAGQVGALGAVEAVELIHHQITQHAGSIKLLGVVLPKALDVWLQQQVVELLVVGEQNIGRSLVQGSFISDHTGGGHRRRIRLIF